MPVSKTLAAWIALVVLLVLPSLASCKDTLDQRNRRADALVQTTIKELGIPGLQIAVVKDNRLVLSKSYGFANVENGKLVTGDTRFPINSATKAFTGVAVMQLAQAGLVDLDAPISRYLDNLPKAWQLVRVRQLLAHTSGLPDILDAQGLIGGGSASAAWSAVQALRVEAPAASRFMYNQTNYVLLSRLIAQVSRMPYDTYVAQRQFNVVGMKTATFGDSYDLVPNAATIYSYLARPADEQDTPRRLSHWFYDVPPMLWSGAGIQASAEDVARWIIALSNGQLVETRKVQAMWEAEPLTGGGKSDWAAGWAVLSPRPSRAVAGIGGARAAFVVYPDDGTAVVVLTNLVGANPERFIPAIAKIYEDGQ